MLKAELRQTALRIKPVGDFPQAYYPTPVVFGEFYVQGYADNIAVLFFDAVDRGCPRPCAMCFTDPFKRINILHVS